MKDSQALNAVGTTVFLFGFVLWVAGQPLFFPYFLMLESSYILFGGLWLQMRERHGQKL